MVCPVIMGARLIAAQDRVQNDGRVMHLVAEADGKLSAHWC